jgi:uncharacterized protein YjbI with pentapeptide repeats
LGRRAHAGRRREAKSMRNLPMRALLTCALLLSTGSSARAASYELASGGSVNPIQYIASIGGNHPYAGPNLAPGASLSLANLSYAYLRTANLSDADLSYAQLASVDLNDANLVWAILTGADMTGVMLIDANLSNADLAGADLTSAYAVEATLYGAGLSGATLSGATLTRGDLSYTDLYDAELAWATLAEADFTGAILAYGNLRNADLSSADLLNTLLIGADLTAADLTGANLTGANPAGATLTDATYDEFTLFPSGNDYTGPTWGLDGGMSPVQAGMRYVPEPGMAWSLGAGIVGLVVAARARRQRAGRRLQIHTSGIASATAAI